MRHPDLNRIRIGLLGDADWVERESREVCDDGAVMHGRSASHAELWDFREELRELFQTLSRTSEADPLRADYMPALDVYETDTSIEVAVDLPGVSPATVRVMIKASVLLIAGEKLPRRGQRDASFHLVERGFGRFARAVRLSGACDAARAVAHFTGGELRVSLPKVTERRGRTFFVPVTGLPGGTRPADAPQR